MRHGPDNKKQGSSKGWLWMAACCVPMIAVVVLVALGFWGSR